jgi:hypothetical protein
MTTPRYVPILAVERGQLSGLAATTDAVKAELTPLFDVLPLDLRVGDDVRDRAARALTGRIKAIQEAWGGGPPRDAYLDCRTGRGDERLTDGRVHLAYLLDEARERGLSLIPVTGLRRPLSYQLAVADAASDDGRGACLRVELADLRDPSVIESRVETFLAAVWLPPESIDLVIDLDEIGHAHQTLLEVTARAVLAPLARLAPWRSVTVAGSAASVHAPERTVARTEWLLWRALVGSSPLGRQLRFGDYGPRWHATRADEAPSPADRARDGHWFHYTHDTEWLVLDSRSRDDDGDVPTLGDIERQPEFLGVSHCAGDAKLVACPPGTCSDPAVWHAAATTHHLTTVVEQLAHV